MNKKYLTVEKTARYYTYGKLTGDTKRVIFALHGYGELAEKFILHFNYLDPKTNYIIAPEGLNKFYLRGFTGATGANWMTKDDRSNDIKDYIEYLDKLYTTEITQPVDEIILFGFSQGNAASTRWLTMGYACFTKLILYAGPIAHDIDWKNNIDKINSLKPVFIVGDNDRFISEEQLKEIEKDMIEKGINYELIRFTGQHEIKKDVIKKILP